MRAKSRLSPYPILNDYSDDYIQSSFTADVSISAQFSEIYGKIQFVLNNKDIQQLIDDKKAKYVAHIECPSTCFRKIIDSFEADADFKILSEQLSDKIEIRTFIVLTENICNFKSDNFNPEYKDASFSIQKNQVIAIGSAIDYTINKDERDIDSLPSIFQITKLKDKKKGSLSVNTDNDDHIIIGLPEDIFQLYAQLGKNIFRSTAFTLIIFPAMIIVLQRMYLMKDDESYSSMHWYQVISSLLEKNRISIEELDATTDSLLSICQSIFSDPISRSFKELETCIERM